MKHMVITSGEEREKLLNSYLPKWPQLALRGQPVTLERAKDIILRTDDFLTDPSTYSGGNNKQFNEDYRKGSHLEKLNDFDNKWDMRELLKNKIGVVDTYYIHNTWASSCYIGGPYGWCSPEGELFSSHNLGKWPSVEKIFSDLKKIAEAFPYLELQATLYSGEECEEDKEPVVSFWVDKGEVHVCSPENPVIANGSTIDKLMLNFNNPNREQGLPPSWIEEYKEKVASVVDEVIKEYS